MLQEVQVLAVVKSADQAVVGTVLAGGALGIAGCAGLVYDDGATRGAGGQAGPLVGEEVCLTDIAADG